MKKSFILINKYFFYLLLLILFISSTAFSVSPDLPYSELYGFSSISNQPLDINQSDNKLLRKIALDTWNYFRDAVDKETHLPVDQLRISPQLNAGGYTSPTNIGMYLTAIISAFDLKFIKKQEAIERIDKCLNAVDRLDTYNGFLYNWYDFRPVLHTQNDFISFVDCGWYAMSLVMIRQTFPKEFGNRINHYLDKMDFSFFYDNEIGQMWHGYYVNAKKYSDYHYGVFCTEARGPGLLVIGDDNIPIEHWFKMYRTLPSTDTWQKQIPEGAWKEYNGIKYFSGYYSYESTKIVPSWGGSMFEFLMPTLFINEEKYASKSLGENNKRAISIHIKESNKLHYPVWGFSPSANPDGDYSEYGIPQIGMKESGYPPEVVTPHATFLALPINPKESKKNIRNLLSHYDIYHPVYGFYDAVNPVSKKIARKFLCLDQGMILLSLNNYLNHGILQKRFAKDPIGKKSLPLLKIERFYD